MDYCNGVQSFIDFATSIPRNFTYGGIRCLCMKCKNKKFMHQDVVTMHLLTKRFIEDYLYWYAHGELFLPNKSMVEKVVGSTSSDSNMHEVRNDNSNPYRNIKSMVEKVVGSTSSASNVHEVVNDNSNPYRNMVMDAIIMNQGNVSQCPIIKEEPNADATRFFDLLKDYDEPL